MEEKKIQRPFIVDIDEAKLEIVQSINNAIQIHGLPFYIADMILSDICAQVKAGAKNELAQARAQEEEFKKIQMQMAETQVEDGAE